MVVYLEAPTFTPIMIQMPVNIPSMEHVGIVLGNLLNLKKPACVSKEIGPEKETKKEHVYAFPNYLQMLAILHV